MKLGGGSSWPIGTKAAKGILDYDGVRSARSSPSLSPTSPPQSTPTLLSPNKLLHSDDHAAQFFINWISSSSPPSSLLSTKKSPPSPPSITPALKSELISRLLHIRERGDLLSTLYKAMVKLDRRGQRNVIIGFLSGFWLDLLLPPSPPL